MATAKELNADLGSLAVGPLSEQLPGAVLALDRTEMALRMADALAAPGAVTACRLVSAILLPGAYLKVRYELEVGDRGSARRPVLVTGHVFPELPLAAAHRDAVLEPLAGRVRGRPEVAPLRVPVALVPSLAMTLSAYPVDGELPTLIEASDPAVAGPVLAALLGSADRPATIAGCSAEPVHYNRRHRCMLRYQLDLADRGAVRLYGKVANDGSGARAPAVVAGLRETLPAAGIAIPECLGFRPDLQLVAFTEIAGAPLVAQLLRARLRGEPEPGGQLTLESAVTECGRVAARLHTSGLQLGDVRPLSVELAALRAPLPAMQTLAPDLSAHLASVLDGIESRVEATMATPLRQCHGDFSYTQLVFAGQRPGLVDFDTLCLAEPALDLGQFLAYLRYAGTKTAVVSGADPVHLTESLATVFTDAYVGAGGPPEALGRLHLYEVTNLVRMAEHAWHNLKSRRLQSILSLLERRLTA